VSRLQEKRTKGRKKLTPGNKKANCGFGGIKVRGGRFVGSNPGKTGNRGEKTGWRITV